MLKKKKQQTLQLISVKYNSIETATPRMFYNKALTWENGV